MTTTEKLQTAASAVAKTSDFQTIADLMNNLLSCDANEDLTEIEGDEGLCFFEQLCELRPECIALAQGRAYIVTVKLNESAQTWFARDEKGDWRSKAKVDQEWPTAEKATRAMFHANEILAIREWPNGDVARAVIASE